MQNCDVATPGGAKVLGREDNGRLAVGAKAALFVVDMTHLALRPICNPIRSMVHAADEGAIRTVFIDGKKVVNEGCVLTIDDINAAT